MANNGQNKHQIDSKAEYTDIWKLWEKGKEYDSNFGIDSEIQKNIDFYEGKQWGIVSEKSKTKHLPRPVINLCELVANTKIAALDAGKTKLQFSSYVKPQSAISLTNFVNYLLGEMKFEDIKRENIFDFIVEGSSCFYAYWDNEALKTVTGHSGGIVVENIKTENIAFANPKLTDIQKQEWVIISQSMTVNKAKSLCSSDDQKDAIVADDEGNENIDGVLPVLTKFWKKRNQERGIDEVWFQRASKMTLIGKEQKISNPMHANELVEKKKKSDQAYLADEVESVHPSSTGIVRLANLYPISFNSYLKRSKNLKGRGVITDMINNQRAINFNLAMMLVSVQNSAWGQRVAKEGALKGQVLTNDPSQVLIDHHQSGAGYYNLNVVPFSQSALLLNQSLIDLVRIVTGTTEVMTGEQKTGMSGVAIATLQERAQKNIDSLVKEYRHGLANLGQVIEMLVAIFYDERESKKYYIEEQEDSNVFKENKFIGTENAEVDYSATVVATNGSQYSEAVELQLLQDLFIGKAIDFETYLKSIPDQLFPNKDKILEDLQSSLQMQLQQKDLQLQQMAEQMQKMSEVVNRAIPVMKENASLKGTVLQIYNEASKKIELANSQNQQTDAAARKMAEELVKSKKMKTTPKGNEAGPMV